VDWINPTGAKKAHSLIDKVCKRKNLEMAWEKVKENRGSGGVDGQNLEAFEAQLNQKELFRPPSSLLIWFPFSSQLSSPAVLPRSIPSPVARSRSFRHASGTVQPSDC
jgi:hypothetical protein